MIKKFFNKPITVVCFIAYILITFYIFFSSLQNGRESSSQSSFVWALLSNVLNVAGNYEWLIRKMLGHFLLFSALAVFSGVVYYRALEMLESKNTEVLAVIITLLVGLLTAVISEVLQLPVFVSGRSAQFSDVLLDFCGYLLGYFVYRIIKLFALYIIYRKRARKN